jgi:pimeloyl-ACP methyl ester carboxylesterase
VHVIDVRTYGTGGPTVVVLHGGPGAPGSVASLARDLASTCRVLEPLQRRGGGAAPLTVARHVEDLDEALAARLGGAPALVVGWSWGAMLGLSFAAAHPARVAALALVGCGTYDETTRSLYRARVAERLGPDGRARQAQLAARLAVETDVAERDRLLAASGALVDGAQAVDPLDDDGVDDSLEVDAQGHAETWADALARQARGVEPASFAAIRAPVLMLHGADDPHPGAATRDLLAHHVRDLAYVEFPRCGHSPWKERHARGPFHAALAAWISAHAPV